MSTFAVFLSLYFLFYFYIFTKTIHLWSFMRKTFLCISTLLYMTNFFCIRIGTLSLYVTRSNPIYIQRFFIFPNTHLYTKVSSYTLVAYTHKNSFPRIIYTQRPSIHIFLLHTCIDKNIINTSFET